KRISELLFDVDGEYANGVCGLMTNSDNFFIGKVLSADGMCKTGGYNEFILPIKKQNRRSLEQDKIRLGKISQIWVKLAGDIKTSLRYAVLALSTMQTGSGKSIASSAQKVSSS